MSSRTDKCAAHSNLSQANPAYLDWVQQLHAKQSAYQPYSARDCGPKVDGDGKDDRTEDKPDWRVRDVQRSRNNPFFISYPK